MSLSIVLSGKNWFLCGPRGINAGYSHTEEFRRRLSHDRHVHHVLVVFGEDGQYFKSFRDDRTGEVRMSWNIFRQGWSMIQGVTRVMDEGVKFISLGEDGHYFMRFREGYTAWNLPDDADDYIKSRPENDEVQNLWLGKDDAWVAQTARSSSAWRLRGNYGSLPQKIEYNGKILALSMNLEYDRNYFVLFQNGVAFGNPSGAPLTVEEFAGWARRVMSIINPNDYD